MLAAWAWTALPGVVFCFVFVAFGSAVPMGTGSLLGHPPHSFLDKATWPLSHRYCTVFSLKGSFLISCPRSCLTKMGKLPATRSNRGNEISGYHRHCWPAYTALQPTQPRAWLASLQGQLRLQDRARPRPKARAHRSQDSNQSFLTPQLGLIIQQIFIECLLCTRYCSRYLGHSREQNEGSCPHGAYSLALTTPHLLALCGPGQVTAPLSMAS